MQKEYNVYALEALSRAKTDAVACHQKYVGTEHILLGLLSGEQTLAGRVLKENGLTYQAFFDAVLRQSAALGDMANVSFQGYSPKAEKILEESEEDLLCFRAITLKQRRSLRRAKRMPFVSRRTRLVPSIFFCLF